MLAPLINITYSKSIFKWTKIEKGDFGEIKRIVARNNFLDYPDFNEEFNIHTDARKFQLGAVIIHNDNRLIYIDEKLIMYRNSIQ